MLDSLRVFAKSWPGKIMGGFLLVGLAGFGINNIITDIGTNTVARVGSAEINSRQFLRAYQNEINAVAQQIGTLPTGEQAMSMGIPSVVLQDLSQNAALSQLADSFGMGVSEDKLGEMLRKDPSFQNGAGVFDPSAFTQIMQMSGMTEAEYFQGQSDAAKRQQLVLSLFGDTKLPTAAVELLNGYVGDKRSIEYFLLGENNVEAPVEPTEAELAEYLGAHQAEFRTVETRRVQMLRLSAADLAAKKTVSDEAIAAEYERSKANLSRPERRTIQQVVLNADQQAAFEAGLAAGTPFETLVADAGLTPTDLGTLTQADITDSRLAQAAFGLSEGGFAIIDGIASKRAVHVSAIDGGGVPALDEVRAQVAETVALNQARNELAEVQDQIEELRAAFRPLTEIAERFGLDLYQADVTASGAELSILPNLAAEDQPRIAQAIYRAEPGALTASISLAGNGNLWFDLESVEPARDQTLDEVRDRVAAALTEERVHDAVLAAQAEAVKRLDAGEALADIAESYNVFPQFSIPFGRFGATDGTIDATVAGAVFAGGDTHHGAAVSQDGDYVVFQVSDVTPASEAMDAAAVSSLDNEARIGIYAEFVSAVRDSAGLRINQQALNDALALYTGQ
ncbi:MAG: hypothetical protein ABS76_23960 [Pelagibacterium sp. SCN 64-44]|nr:MAG: hypothetical protein ABS76_23960 [Pelagibacterium sp. SCN 64-44]